METDKTIVENLIEDWFDNIQKQDIEKVMQYHSDDIVIFDVPKPLQSKGLTEYKKTWELFFKNVKKGIDSFKPIEFHLRVDKQVAFAFGLIKIHDATVRLSIGLEKRNGTWSIVHEHHSYPIVVRHTKKHSSQIKNTNESQDI